jgi:hypothetical protein
MSGEGNEGIIIHGGSFEAENVAVGRRAKVDARVYVTQQDEVLRALEDFRRELDRYADEVPDSPAVRSTAEALEGELRKPARNPVTIRGLIAGLTDAVKTVTPLVGAAEALKVAVAALL